jgi:hydrogenase maturation protease
MADDEMKDEQSFSDQNSSAHPLISIFGLGNPLLGDDGVGWAIAQQVQDRLAESPEYHGLRSEFRVEVDTLSLGGLSLMEQLADCKKAILIDSIVTGNHPLGTVMHFDLAALPAEYIGHMSSAHDVSLTTALEVGRSMGIQLPEIIEIVVVESQIVYEFSEELSPSVAAAVPEAVRLTLEILEQLIN